MRILLIVNPVAGQGRAALYLEQIELILGAHHTLETFLTARHGDAAQEARELDFSRAEVIIVAGGDGTLNEVLNGLLSSGKRIPVGFIPLGTTSVFAWEMHLPLHPVEAARGLDAALQNGLPTVSVDLMRIRSGEAPPRYGVLMASAGMDAAAVENTRTGQKKRFGRWSYIYHGWKAWWVFRHPPLRVESLDPPFTLTGHYALIANARAYGGNFPIALQAKHGDGELDLCVLERGSRWDFFKFICLGIAWRLHPRQRAVSFARTRRVRVLPLETGPGGRIPLQVDGEAWGELPMDAEIVPRALEVITPPPEAVPRRPTLFLNMMTYDILAFAFVAFLTAVTLLFHARIPAWRELTIEYAILLGALVAFADNAARRPRPLWRGLHIGFPIPLTILLYESLGALVTFVNPHQQDHRLLALDRMLFGLEGPVVWLSRLSSPALTDYLQTTYSAYLFLPSLVALWLYWGRGQDEFEEGIGTLGLTYFLSYIGYMLVPADGPRYHLHLFPSLAAAPLPTGLIGNWIARTLTNLEFIRFDCFPSGHTAVMLVVLGILWRRSRTFFWWCLPVVISLVVATMYCRYHYTVDILAGGLLAAGCLWWGPRLHRWWGRTGVSTWRRTAG